MVQIATQLKFILYQSNGVGDAELAGELTTLVLQVTTLKANGRLNQPGVGQHLYVNAKQRLLDIVTAPRPSS